MKASRLKLFFEGKPVIVHPGEPEPHVTTITVGDLKIVLPDEEEFKPEELSNESSAS